jgi:hypothetical protein
VGERSRSTPTIKSLQETRRYPNSTHLFPSVHFQSLKSWIPVRLLRVTRGEESMCRRANSKKLAASYGVAPVGVACAMPERIYVGKSFRGRFIKGRRVLYRYFRDYDALLQSFGRLLLYQIDPKPNSSPSIGRHRIKQRWTFSRPSPQPC